MHALFPSRSLTSLATAALLRLGLLAVLVGALLSCLSGCASPDVVASAITGRDCNPANLDYGRAWCAPAERPPAPQPYCTQGWSGVDCWARPDLMPNVARQVTQGPTALTPAQDQDRTGQ